MTTQTTPPTEKSEASDQPIVGLLLGRVDDWFANVGEDSQTYKYTLGRMSGHWRFRVVNSWQNWIHAGLQHEFHGLTAGEAVLKFIEYVESRNVNIKGLAE